MISFRGTGSSLLRCAKEGGGSRGDAFVCGGRPCLWAAAHDVSDYGMASAGGKVAWNDWDDFGVGAPGSHRANNVRASSNHLIASSAKARQSVWRLTSSSAAT